MCNVRFSNFGGQTKQESKLGVQTSSYFENQAKNQGQTTSESRIEAKNQGQTKSESKKGVQTRPYFENQDKKQGQTKQKSTLGVQTGYRLGTDQTLFRKPGQKVGTDQVGIKTRKMYIAHTFSKDKTKTIEIFLVNSKKTANRSQNRGQTMVFLVCD